MHQNFQKQHTTPELPALVLNFKKTYLLKVRWEKIHEMI